MVVSRKEFLDIVRSCPTHAIAARTLRVTQQSLESRLARIKVRPSEESENKVNLTRQQLEAAWSEALEDLDYTTADAYFGEMCRRSGVRSA